MIELNTKFLKLTIEEPDNDNDRRVLVRDLVSANSLLFAALRLIEAEDEDGGFDLVYLQNQSDQSH